MERTTTTASGQNQGYYISRLVEAGKRYIKAITPAKEECNKHDMNDVESSVHCELLSACIP